MLLFFLFDFCFSFYLVGCVSELVFHLSMLLAFLGLVIVLLVFGCGFVVASCVAGWLFLT